MPQLENGFTKIANELLDELAKIRIPGEARQIFDVILRKTYGFNKKTDKIPLSQFQRATGMKRPNVCRAIKKLIEMNLIFTSSNNDTGSSNNDTSYITQYGINKDFTTWIRVVSKKIPLVSKVIMGSSNNDTKTSSNNDTLKRNKETISKEITLQKNPTPNKSAYSFEFESFWSSYPAKVGKGVAFKSFKKAIKKASIDEIMNGLDDYVNSKKVADGFICNPATWLNQERWSDECEPATPMVDDTYFFSPEEEAYIYAMEERIAKEEEEKKKRQET